jgi:hypothetical protein
MKKQFICAIATSFAFLACSNSEQVSDSPVNKLCKQSESSPINIPYERLDPICKNESRELVYITDLHLEEVDYDKIGGSISGGGSVDENGFPYYFINDEIVSYEEYLRISDEWYKKYSEQLKGLKSRRDLPIPCVITIAGYKSWIALLTKEEIAELQEKYGELAFGEVSVPVPTSDDGGNGSVAFDEGCR